MEANNTHENLKAKLAKRLGTIAGCAHFALFLATVFYIQRSSDPQGSLVWVYWSFADFPVSILYMLVGGDYGKFLTGLGDSWIGYCLYPPHVIHGLGGTIWWLFLPRLLLAKKYGGLWGGK